MVASPVISASSASAGAQAPVSATHGDCKNDNSGKHNGYVCPVAPVTPPVTVTTTPPVTVTVTVPVVVS
jgi:hypothetical protein